MIFCLRFYFPWSALILDNAISLFPTQLIDKFNNINLINLSEFRRINLWYESVNIIFKRPVFGLGAAFFPILYQIYYKPSYYTERHTHNLFLELAASYGVIISLVTIIFTFSLIILAWKSIREKSYDNKQLIINRCWLAASIIIVFSQMYDLTYYDGRISGIFWILLSGLKNII